MNGVNGRRGREDQKKQRRARRPDARQQKQDAAKQLRPDDHLPAVQTRRIDDRRDGRRKERDGGDHAGAEEYALQ